jgi:MFS family permease
MFRKTGLRLTGRRPSGDKAAKPGMNAGVEGRPVEDKADTPTEDRSRYRWYVLGVLVCVYMLHHLDRMVLTLLQEPIKHEFNLSDSQLGLITGTAYAFAFGIAGLPLGMLVDRTNRVRLLALVLTVWSGLTALASTANSFATLFLIRVGIGAAESGGTPTNLSLISDYFAKNKRSTAIGIYLVGSQIGTLVGFAITGIVAKNYGWRAALLVAGIPGLVLMVVLLLTVREPVRQMTQKLAPLAAFKVIGANPLLLHLIIGLTLANVVAPGISSWTPSFLIRSHGVDVGVVGVTMALAIYPFSTAASILAGMLTDRVASRHASSMFRMMAFSAMLIVPTVLIGLFTGSFALALAMFAVQHVMHMFINTPGYALAMSYVPSNMRGTTAAVLQVLSNLIGFGIGPMVGGLLSDVLKPHFGADSLRWALAIFVFLSLWTAAHLWRASVLARRAPQGDAAVPVSV